MSPCVWFFRRATRSMWYGEVRLSLWPITSWTLIPYLQRSQFVSASEERRTRGLPSTASSELPTCSIPIAV